MNKAWRLFRYDWPIHFILLVTNWLPDNVLFYRVRGFLTQFFLGNCGKNLRLGRNVVFYNPAGIDIGNNVFLAYGCWLAAGGEIKVGDEVMFGPYVVISAGNHTRSNGSYRYGPTERLCISIGKGAWIGSHATILGGANIGEGCMVGAGACVTRGDLPKHSFVAGIPATVKKHLDQ